MSYVSKTRLQKVFLLRNAAIEKGKQQRES